MCQVKAKTLEEGQEHTPFWDLLGGKTDYNSDPHLQDDETVARLFRARRQPEDTTTNGALRGSLVRAQSTKFRSTFSIVFDAFGCFKECMGQFTPEHASVSRHSGAL